MSTIDPAVAKYLAAQKQAAQAAKAQSENEVNAVERETYLKTQVDAAFEHIKERLKTIASQMSSAKNDCRLGEDSAFSVTLTVGFEHYTIQSKFYGPKDSGTMPGLLVIMPNHQELSFIGSLAGNTFYFATGRNTSINLRRRLITTPGYSADEIVDYIMQDSTARVR